MPEFTSPKNTWATGTQARPSIHSGTPPAQPSPRVPPGWGVRGPRAHLSKPAMADLLQVEQALPPQVRRLEELHCNRARPAARVSPCPPAHPSPCPPACAPRHSQPSPAALTVPPAARPSATPGCSGASIPRNPSSQASSPPGILPRSGTWAISVPKRDGSRAGSLPLLLRRVCRAEPGTALAFTPSRPPRHRPAPRQPVPRAGSNGAIVGPLCPSRCGHSLGRE